MNICGYIKRLFTVHKCASCRQILSYDSFDDALCRDCRLAFDVAKTENCPECAKAAFECSCQPKTLSSAGSLCLRKLYFYHTDKSNEPQNKMLYFIKRNRSKRSSLFIAEQLWQSVSKEINALELPLEFFVITNVPRGRRAVIEYGFDQSEEICKAFSRVSGVKYSKLLLRKLGGKEQKKLNATQRRKNIKKLIYPNEKSAASVEGKYVILFDDVVTTGASMAVCLPILRKMGAKGVICCTLANDLKNKRVI